MAVIKTGILLAIELERVHQDRKYGGPEHDDAHNSYDWLAYLTKHLGRAVTNDASIFKRQMVILAALAVAAIEWAERKEE